MTLTGDTDNVVGNPGWTEDDGFVIPVNFFFGNPSFATTVNIAGLGLVTITDPSAVYAFPTPVDIDEDGDIDPPIVIVRNGRRSSGFVQLYRPWGHRQR